VSADVKIGHGRAAIASPPAIGKETAAREKGSFPRQLAPLKFIGGKKSFDQLNLFEGTAHLGEDQRIDVKDVSLQTLGNLPGRPVIPHGVPGQDIEQDIAVHQNIHDERLVAGQPHDLLGGQFGGRGASHFSDQLPALGFPALALYQAKSALFGDKLNFSIGKKAEFGTKLLWDGDLAFGSNFHFLTFTGKKVFVQFGLRDSLALD
jgi:hypothetical protein